ncbi:MAG TPA: SDR family NAD(P)-dependent oxidoreductase, partial [Spirochaetia bacterium]|nr:SDR family NAD(P)-dependent oxidoreductase [Spirochaetia bacterium]
MRQEGRMKGKRVLVTGAGTGIGQGIAQAFMDEGADVAVHYSHSEKGALEIVARADGLGLKARAFKADFTRIEEVKGLAGEAVRFLGGLDILVNNSGISLNLPFERVAPEQFDTVYNVNIRAMFFLTQSCLGPMLENPGSDRARGVVINISSLHGFRAMAGYTVYSSTKGAIAAFTRTLAIELAPKGIRVNAIAPGAVEV